MPSSDFLKEFNLTNEQLDKFDKYTNLLKDWNQKIDLTNITEDN